MLGTFAGFLTINTFFLFLVIFGRFWPFWHFRDFWAFLGPPVGPPGPKYGLGCILRSALYHFRGLETTQGRPKCHLGKKFFSKENFFRVPEGPKTAKSFCHILAYFGSFSRFWPLVGLFWGPWGASRGQICPQLHTMGCIISL